MISKRVAPPRPPLPKTTTTTASKKTENANDDPKRLDFFSIRYSRDDGNESDEEISIVRKEDNIFTSDNIENEDGTEDVPTTSTTSPVETKETTSSILSSLTLPFLSRSPSKNSIDSLSSSSDDKTKSVQTNEETNGVKLEGNVDMVHGPLLTDDQISTYFSSSPPKSKGERLTNAVVSSAISLSSLLKKDVSKVGSETTAVETCSKKDILTAAVHNTSLLFNVPLGMTENDNHETTAVKKEIDLPIYNLLILSTIVFLYHMLPTTSFMNGVVAGSMVTFFLVCGLMWLLTPELSEEEQYKKDVIEHDLEMKQLKPRKIRQALEPFQLSKPQDLESWFYKATCYNHTEPIDFNDPEQVIPVFATLVGHTLTFNIPRKEDRSKIKRSNMLERNDNIKYASSKEYDLKYGGDIELVPLETLTLKRVWAKKYPIFLKIFESPVRTEDEKEPNFEIPTVTEEFYLFSPTGRGKEEWFYRIEKLLKPKLRMANEIESIFNTRTSFPHYMAQLIGAEKNESSQLTWVNALLGRLFWDVWQSEYWVTKVKSRIQNKISRMKLPPFIRYLKVTDMRLGNALPTIQRAHNLMQDNRGIWVDLDVDYQGGIMLTIETMINLEYYLKQLTDQGKNEAEVVLRFSRDDSADYSDESSTGESDGEEDDGDWSECRDDHVMSPGLYSGSGSGDDVASDTEPDSELSTGSSELPVAEQDNQGWSGKVKNPKGKKILNMLEKVAKSKWVQKAAETKVVQRAVEKFSNLPIVLGVEVVRLRGTLAANIPPPPSNRLWLGFHSNPLLSLIARPKLGERHVRLTHVTDWIQYKLKQEFKSMFVLPNMEDLTIRIMNSGLEEKFPVS